METDKRIAPRKSIRRSLVSWECLGYSSRSGTWSFQITRVRARRVGGHCPRKDLWGIRIFGIVTFGKGGVYHRHPTVSVRKPPMGPPRLLPDVAAIFT